MNAQDKSATPWPAPGKWFEWRFRPAVWAFCAPIYNENNVRHSLSDIVTFWIMKQRFPFLTWNIPYFIHGYIGFKPIPVERDPAFYWRDMDAVKKELGQEQLFVQIGLRGGIGKID